MLDTRNSKSPIPYYCKHTRPQMSTTTFIVEPGVTSTWTLLLIKFPRNPPSCTCKASIEPWATSITFGLVTCAADSHKLVVGLPFQTCGWPHLTTITRGSFYMSVLLFVICFILGLDGLEERYKIATMNEWGRSGRQLHMNRWRLTKKNNR